MATINITEVAEALETDARTARKFLRSVTPKDEQPGKGSRWAIEKKSMRSLKAKFPKWDEARRPKVDSDDAAEGDTED